MRCEAIQRALLAQLRWETLVGGESVVLRTCRSGNGGHGVRLWS